MKENTVFNVENGSYSCDNGNEYVIIDLKYAGPDVEVYGAIDIFNFEAKVVLIVFTNVRPNDDEIYHEHTDIETNQHCWIKIHAEPVENRPEEKAKEKPYGQLDCNVEFLEPGCGKGFEEVAGMDELKEHLTDAILYPFRNKELAEQYRLKSINGMLLWGPPGCGKTYIAEHFAAESGMSYAMVKGSDMACIWSHGTQSLVASVFEKAQAQAPCVLCFDEIETLIPARGSLGSDTGSVERAEVCNEFLAQLNNSAERGIFVIGTTNNPQSIDAAMLRTGRLEEKFYVSAPDKEARRALFVNALKGRPLADIDYEQLVGQSVGYVASDITAVANRAALLAMKQETGISMSHLEEAMKQILPSLSKEELAKYEALNLKMKGKSGTCVTRPMPAIGFTAANYSRPVACKQ